MIAIFLKELRSYFFTPLGWVFIGLFLSISGIFFTVSNIFTGSVYFASYLSQILFIFLLLVPLLTMRLYSEEMKLRNDQLLLTSPLTLTAIVFGKYLSAFFVFFIALIFTLIFPLIIALHGDLAVAESIGAYLGFLLIGAAYIAIGTFISASTSNQIIASLLTFFALLSTWLLDMIEGQIPMEPLWGLIALISAFLAVGFFLFFNTKNIILGILPPVLALVSGLLLFFLMPEFLASLIPAVLSWFSLRKRFIHFQMGLLKLDAIIYLLSFTGAFLFLTGRMIEKRRWA